MHTAVVERRPELSATVRATGKLDVAVRFPVPLTQPGTVRLIAVNVGDSVHAGDMLAALDDTPAASGCAIRVDALDAAQYGLTNARRA